MTEDDARAAIRELFDTEAVARLERMAVMVVAENDQQNLIAPASVAHLWTRHMMDSLQLGQWRPDGAKVWLDIGTGGGFPGLALAAVLPMAFVLVEPRRRRAAFLADAAAHLGIADRVTVEQRKVEAIAMKADVISARAVASPENLLRQAHHCATATTRWLLPRGQLQEGEMAQLTARWKGVFHVEHSITAEESRIIVADGAMPR